MTIYHKILIDHMWRSEPFLSVVVRINHAF